MCLMCMVLRTTYIKQLGQQKGWPYDLHQPPRHQIGNFLQYIWPFFEKNNLLQFDEIYFAGGRAKSPTKRVASRPPSASTASSSVAPSPAPVQGEAANKQSAASQNQQQQPPKRQRPSELIIRNYIRETI